MKRSLILALCAILAASVLFVACGGDNNDPTDTKAAGNGTTAPALSGEDKSDVVSDNDTAAQKEPDDETYDDPDTVVPGVNWTDLQDITDDAPVSSDTDKEDPSDTVDPEWPFPESGIELPVIPLP